jgi:hypothetical protein
MRGTPPPPTGASLRGCTSLPQTDESSSANALVGSHLPPGSVAPPLSYARRHAPLSFTWRPFGERRDS